mmetsp:Transcript_53975/g.128627  ORF Transcript_53975/g.128627 Transcript_53975/m.128627 type:complete len:146 (+) Transcript_53975:237-674(+)
MSPPAPPTTLADFININQQFQQALREMGHLDSQLSAPTPASGGMGAVPGGTFLLNGVAISWKSKKQPYMSPAANIDKKCETAHGAAVKTPHGAAVKTAHGAAVKTADGATSDDSLQEGSIDIKNFTNINNMIKTAAGAAPGLTAG